MNSTGPPRPLPSGAGGRFCSRATIRERSFAASFVVVRVNVAAVVEGGRGRRRRVRRGRGAWRCAAAHYHLPLASHASLSPHSLAIELATREHLRGTGNTETGEARSVSSGIRPPQRVGSGISPPQRVSHAELQAAE